MKKLLTFVSLGVCMLFLTNGCAAVNKGLDKAKEPVKELGKPVGKTMDVIGSVSEGATEGMDEENKENPFNR